MRILVILFERGRYPLIRWSAFGWQLRISLQRRDDQSLLSLVGDHSSSRGGFHVKDDQLQQTTVAPTAAAPRPGSTSH